MTLGEGFGLYRFDVIVYRSQSAKTEEAHQHALKLLQEYLGDLQFTELTFDQVRGWKAHLLKDRSEATAREYISRLRVVLRHLRRRGFDVIDHELVALPRRPEKVPDFLTKEQVAELLKAVGNPMRGYSRLNRLRNQAVVSLLYASGIRAAELCSLDRASIREDNTFTIIGKGKKPRLCFIDGRTRGFLDDYLGARVDSNPALFISDQNGRRITKSTLQRIFETARTKVNFTVSVHPHILRHSFATNLLRNNTNVRYVQEFLGHSSIQTTQMYMHVVNTDLHQIYLDKHTN
jgi:site-specific recombinase XerD